MFVGILSRPSSITSQIPQAFLNFGPWIVENCPKLGFPLSKSTSLHPVFIKLGEYVGGHNISTKFYNLPNPPGTPKLWLLNCQKLGFPLSKSTSFHPVFIKLSEYVGGHNSSTKFCNLSNPPWHSWIMALELSKKTELAVSALQVEYPVPKNVVITIELTTNKTGVFCVSLALLFIYKIN